jgi:geranylgeranyl reductase family protein
MMHDVIIIGGGPAGAFCAEQLAREGFSCTLLERSKPYRYKSCGGGISFEGSQITPPPSSIIQRKIVCGRIYSPHHAVEVGSDKEPGYTVYRTEYDQWLRERAEEQGAQIQYGEEVRKVNLAIPTVKTTRELKSRVVVGAFGACPCLYDQFGVSISGWIQLIQQEFSLPEDEVTDRIGDCIELYFNTQYASYGYSWIFPKREGVTVGSIFTPRTLKKRQRLTAFIQDHQEKLRGVEPKKFKKKYTSGGFLPLDPVSPLHGVHHILVGDSAGFCDPITFEGISNALKSGKIAAEVIESHLENDVPLAHYEHRWKSELYHTDIQYAQKLRNLLFGHSLSDRVMDAAVDLAYQDATMMKAFQWLLNKKMSRKKVYDLIMSKKMGIIKRLGVSSIKLLSRVM